MGAETSTEEAPENHLKRSKLCKDFFKNPTLDNFYTKKGDDLSLFRYAARSRWDLSPLTKSESLFLNLKANLLMNSEISSAKDLDYLWCLYHATGDQKYLDRIKSLFEGKEQTEPITKLALYSYQNYIGA